MTNDEDDFIARALGRLPREMTPPPGLEDVTVRHLQAAGVLRVRPRLGLSVASWLLAAGVAAIAFVGGTAFATRMASTARNAPQDSSDAPVRPALEPTYALLLYGASSGDDSAAHAVRAAEYAAWARASHASARVVGGEALGMAVASVALATVRRGVDSIIVGDAPDGAGDFVGYFLVQAPDREAALALARTCPHLRFGGRVVVRRVWPSRQALAVLPVRDSGGP